MKNYSSQKIFHYYDVVVAHMHTQCLNNSAEYGEQSVLALGSQVPSAYPAMCGIQREAKKRI